MLSLFFTASSLHRVTTRQERFQILFNIFALCPRFKALQCYGGEMRSVFFLLVFKSHDSQSVCLLVIKKKKKKERFKFHGLKEASRNAVLCTDCVFWYYVSKCMYYDAITGSVML